MQRTIPAAWLSSRDSASRPSSLAIAFAWAVGWWSSIARIKSKTSGPARRLTDTSAKNGPVRLGGGVMLSRSFTSHSIAREMKVSLSSRFRASANARWRFCRCSVQMRLVTCRKATIRFPSPGMGSIPPDSKWLTTPNVRAASDARAPIASIARQALPAVLRRSCHAAFTRARALPAVNSYRALVTARATPARAAPHQGSP